MAEGPALRIELLGRVGITVDGAAMPPDAWRRKRALELLKLLALAPGQVLHREEIIDALWPDKDLSAGANNLNRTLYDLRKQVGDGRVVLSKGVARLSADVWVDVAAFETAVGDGDRESLTRAVQLYRGDLCVPTIRILRRSMRVARRSDSGLRTPRSNCRACATNPEILTMRSMRCADWSKSIRCRRSRSGCS